LVGLNMALMADRRWQPLQELIACCLAQLPLPAVAASSPDRSRYDRRAEVLEVKGVFGFILLKFNSHHINVFLKCMEY
jgi:hypothetical protein